MFSRRENLGLPLAFVGVVLFGGTLPATRLAVESLDPWFVTFARAAIAGPAALASLLVVVFLPRATMIAGAWIAHERPSAGFWLTALAGTALVVSYALRHGGGDSFAAGDLFLLFGIATGAIGNAYSGRLVRVMPGWEVISWALVLVLPPSLVLALMLAPENRGAIPGSAWMALSYVAIVSQWVAFFPWNLGFKLAGIARVAQVQLLQTFVTLGLAALVNGEAMHLAPS